MLIDFNRFNNLFFPSGEGSTLSSAPITQFALFRVVCTLQADGSPPPDPPKNGNDNGNCKGELLLPSTTQSVNLVTLFVKSTVIWIGKLQLSYWLLVEANWAPQIHTLSGTVRGGFLLHLTPSIGQFYDFDNSSLESTKWCKRRWLPVSNKAQFFARFVSASNAAFSVDLDKPMLVRETTIHRDSRKSSGHNMIAL